MSQTALYQDQRGVRIGAGEFSPGAARAPECPGPIPLEAIGSASVEPLVDWRLGAGWVIGGLLLGKIIPGLLGSLIGLGGIVWGCLVMFHPSRRAWRLVLVGRGGAAIARHPLVPYPGPKGKESLEAMVRAIAAAPVAAKLAERAAGVAEDLDAARAQQAAAPEDATARGRLAAALQKAIDVHIGNADDAAVAPLIDEFRRLAHTFVADHDVRLALAQSLVAHALSLRARGLRLEAADAVVEVRTLGLLPPPCSAVSEFYEEARNAVVQATPP